MRKIDWNAALTPEDIAWLRQAGFMSEEQIAAHQTAHGAQAPGRERIGSDTLTRSATGNDPVPQPENFDEDESDEDGEPFEDDYEEWKPADLEKEVGIRNAIEGKSDVQVTGTGKDGRVLKADLIKGLRLWDQENPQG